ncbi:PREDICTED: uncharacterized protein LOC108772664 [Cyphomyrmex costatus]|uniref:uncharacterized protein LOC108772664 n=1 Tax=Cyphomyrmex costatus TaxID=456900 RepID=UPI00085238DA|nr:PREDICTED: uncharacterized protein LOC108772664 [Cyphomyrmex costatus]
MLIATLLLFILTIFILTIFVCNYYVYYGKNRRLISLIPGPPGYPILGNAFLLLGSREKQWNTIVGIFNQYYPIFRFQALFVSAVIICHPDDIQTILSNTKHLEKSILYDFFKPWIGSGLITSKAIKWHSRRKILTTTFHLDILQQFVDVLIQEGENMTKFLKNSKDTVVNDVVSFVSEYTLNAICETAMGTSLRDHGSFQQQYREAIFRITEIITYRLSRPLLFPDWIFSLTSKGKQQTRNLEILHAFTEQIIAGRKLYHEQTNGRNLKNLSNDISAEFVAEKIGTQRKRLAMLDLLIAASREGLMTESDIREEVDTFTFAGHDTTATGLSFLLALLAEHKDIQDRVRNEIDSAMQENDEKISMKLLQQLPYLERCIKEALRLYPSAPFIIRVSGEDVKLQSYLVPAGTNIVINIYDVNRNPNFWPNSEVFDPDRFLPEKNRNRHPYSFITFSAGPRNCIGQRFAMLEMKIMTAFLVHNFYLEPIDYLKNLSIQFDFILRLTHPLRIKFISRPPGYPIFGNTFQLMGSPAQRKRLAMLDLLIATSREGLMTDLDIREEVDTFMSAGHDATATGLSFLLALLAEHKDIQVMIFESYVVPAGINILIHIYGVNRDPNFWPNPEVFDPDRFLPERDRNRHPYSYITFSAGPRNCIGQRFAMLELKVMAASLYGKNGRLFNLIPGPPGYPIFGNVFQLLGSREKQWNAIVGISNQYYPIVKLRIFFLQGVIIRDPDDIQTILSNTKHLEKSILYDFFKPSIGSGLITSKETAMGTSLQDHGDFQKQYREAIFRITEIIMYRMLRPWLHSDWIFSLTPKGKQQARNLKILHGFTEQIIAERKLYHERTNGRYLKNLSNDISAEFASAKNGTQRKRLAMLDLLIAASREGLMTDLDIREEVDTFMSAGHDTTATGLSFLLGLLAEHKDIQDRVRNEIDSAMQENEEKISMKLLQQLPYLERCIKEALRLYPSVPFISRVSGEDVKLQSYLVPAGTILAIHIFGINRDPNFWPNPEVFDPDRFLPEKDRNRHPYSYITFSAGPRNCIGQRFAMLELKAMAASLVHNFYLEPVDYLKNLSIQLDIVLRLSHPLRIKFVPRFQN